MSIYAALVASAGSQIQTMIRRSSLAIRATQRVPDTGWQQFFIEQPEGAVVKLPKTNTWFPVIQVSPLFPSLYIGYPWHHPEYGWSRLVKGFDDTYFYPLTGKLVNPVRRVVEGQRIRVVTEMKFDRQGLLLPSDKLQPMGRANGAVLASMFHVKKRTESQFFMGVTQGVIDIARAQHNRIDEALRKMPSAITIPRARAVS